MTTKECMVESPDDLDLSHYCLDDGERFFAQVVGCIEDILMDDGFLNLHKDFMEEHWQKFVDDEENRLEYTDIFMKYVQTVEKFIEEQLIKHVPHFNMINFENELKKRPNELDGEVFEILSTFTNFTLFKEKFLDYRAMKEGKVIDFSKDFNVMQCKFENF